MSLLLYLCPRCRQQSLLPGSCPQEHGQLQPVEMVTRAQWQQPGDQVARTAQAWERLRQPLRWRRQQPEQGLLLQLQGEMEQLQQLAGSGWETSA